MKHAKQYPVTFGYLAKTTINGKAYTHRGTDRACPSGTPIVIGNTTIGLTGNTGFTTGAHLHLQAGTDLACQNTINPEPYAFKGGKVVALRTTNEKQWGKYITLKVGTKYITYAHLSKVNVKVGQVITEDEMLTNKNHLKALTRQFLGKDPDTKLMAYLGKPYAYAVDKFTKARKDLPTALKQNAELTKALKIKDNEITRLNKELSAKQVSPDGNVTLKDILNAVSVWVRKFVSLNKEK